MEVVSFSMVDGTVVVEITSPGAVVVSPDVLVNSS